MADTAIPCYGGPFDGRFYTNERPPSGYKQFTVKNRIIYLYKGISVHRLDLETIDRAAHKKLPPGEEIHK